MNLPIRKLTFNLFLHQLLRYRKIGAIILSIIMLSATGIFLYRNFYKVITQVEMIKILREQVTGAKIDSALYTQITEKINDKKTPPEENLEELKNPFLPY